MDSKYMTVWTPKHMTNPQMGFAQGCVKFSFGNRELSIAMDDSCGNLPECSRADIQLYINEADGTGSCVTEEVLGSSFVAFDVEVFEKAMAWLKG